MHVEVLKCHDEKVNHFQKIKMRVVKISMNVRSIKTNHHSKGHIDLLKGSEPIVHINY